MVMFVCFAAIQILKVFIFQASLRRFKPLLDRVLVERLLPETVSICYNILHHIKLSYN